MSRISKLGACVAVLGILVAAPAAFGQASNQYTPQLAPTAGPGAPTLDQAGVIASGGNDGSQGVAGAQEGSGVASEAGEADGGKLPFTGYPMTPLVALVALMLAAGFALRIVAPPLDRRRI